jgi:hypothetical protein
MGSSSRLREGEKCSVTQAHPPDLDIQEHTRCELDAKSQILLPNLTKKKYNRAATLQLNLGIQYGNEGLDTYTSLLPVCVCV